MKRILAMLGLALALPGCAIPRPIIDLEQGVWTAQASNVTETLAAVQFLDVTTGYAVGDNGLVLKTGDGGASWIPIFPVAVAGKKLVGLSFLNAQQGYAISEGALYLTEDGGGSWKEVRDFQAEAKDTLRTVRFITPGVGFVVGSKGVYQTLDAGATWDLAAVERGSAVEQGGASVYVVGNYVYRTDLTGVYTGVPASGAICTKGDNCAASLHFPSAAEGWLFAGAGDTFGGDASVVVKHTRDGGQTWEDGDPAGQLRKEVKSMGPWAPKVRFATPEQGWVVVNGDFLATRDGGRSWKRQAQFLKEAKGERFQEWSIEDPIFGLRDLSVVDATHAWLVGTDGRIFKYENRYYPPLVDDNGLMIGSWRCCP